MAQYIMMYYKTILNEIAFYINHKSAMATNIVKVESFDFLNRNSAKSIDLCAKFRILELLQYSILYYYQLL